MGRTSRYWGVVVTERDTFFFLVRNQQEKGKGAGELTGMKCVLYAWYCGGSCFPLPSSGVPFPPSFSSFFLSLLLFFLVPLMSSSSSYVPFFPFVVFPINHLLSHSILLFFIIQFHNLIQCGLPVFGLKC